jgi:hypothetical protein
MSDALTGLFVLFSGLAVIMLVMGALGGSGYEHESSLTAADAVTMIRSRRGTAPWTPDENDGPAAQYASLDGGDDQDLSGEPPGTAVSLPPGSWPGFADAPAAPEEAPRHEPERAPRHEPEPANPATAFDAVDGFQADTLLMGDLAPV